MAEISAKQSDLDYCYLTTTGRVTGRPHTIEIWFGAMNSTVFMLAGGRDGADWVRNIRHSAEVTVQIDDLRFAAKGRIVDEAEEDALARELLVTKYRSRYNGDLEEWGRTALLVAVDLP